MNRLNIYMDAYKFFNSKRNGFTFNIGIPTLIKDVATPSDLERALCLDKTPCIVNVIAPMILPIRGYKPLSNKVLNGNGMLTIQECISINDVRNVIISNCIFDNKTDKDCINISSSTYTDIKTDLIWILNNKFVKAGDGAIDITGAKRVNIQGNHFCKIQKACLWGRSNAGTPEKPHNTEKLITHSENYYESCDRRMPLLRGGYCHSFNNVITEFFAAGTQVGEVGYLLSEGNWYGGKCPLFKKSVASNDFDFFSKNFALGVEEEKEVTKDLNYWSRGDVETLFGKVNKKYLKDITMDFIRLFKAWSVNNNPVAKMNEARRDLIISNAGAHRLS